MSDMGAFWITCGLLFVGCSTLSAGSDVKAGAALIAEAVRVTAKGK